jgi:glycosyltransferase involved in cell wall biosynthesis
MQIFLVESYYDGSHKSWADGLIANSKHNFTLFNLPGRSWKWRMQGSAITIAELINKKNLRPDIILSSSLIDLACLRTLVNYKNIKYVLYMHENQLTYPLSIYSKDNYQELSLGYLNYKSCLSSDYVIFNSEYHQRVFLDACTQLLLKMPDYQNLYSIDRIKEKSTVIPVGLDTGILNQFLSSGKCNETESPTLLWNHRWEYDKNPDLFLKLISDLEKTGIDFRLNFTNIKNNDLVNKIKNDYGHKINYIGHCHNYEDYLQVLLDSDIIPVTSSHDFFGLSVLEAIYMGCQPILPNDLCYSEHFISDPAPYIYADYEELLSKTLFFIKTWKFKSPKTDNPSIKDYNWKKVVERYDNYLEGIV